MDMKAAIQLVLTAAELGVVGHCASWRWEPAKPPILVWTSHMPDGVPEMRLYSIKIAPAWAPWVLTIVSDHSIEPRSPGLPIRTTGFGFLMSPK